MTLKRDLEFWTLFLVVFSVFLIGTGFYFNTPSEIVEGYRNILTSPSLLLSDYMQIGTIGSALINAGICTLIGVFFINITKTPISGSVVAACMNITGFALLGKNPFNILPPILGVYAFALFNLEDLEKYTPTALFACGIAPIVSYITYFEGFNTLHGVILGPIIGFIIGFIMPPVSHNVVSVHYGYSHYNNGFSLGIIGSLAASLLTMFGIEVTSTNVIMTYTDYRLVYIMYGFMILLLLPQLFLRKGFGEYKSLLKRVGIAPSSFATEYSYSTVLFNMGLVGIMGMTYVLLIDSNLNGITLGGVIVMMAFSTFGLHPRNAFPIMLGIFIAGTIGIYDVNSESFTIAALFGTTLAPIAGKYGIFKGIIAGIAHAALVTRTGFLHDGLVLYNNGFAAGLVSTIILPFYDIIHVKKDRRY